jgi:deoxyribonuclease V
MKTRYSHRWDLSPKDAIALQNRLAKRIRLRNGVRYRDIRIIAGADVSYSKATDHCFAAVVVLTFPELSVVEEATHVCKAPYPYIPGLLTFREAPPLIRAFARIRTIPHVLVFDSQGIAHPRRMGLATHLGILFDLPSIGCAKSRLWGHYGEQPSTLGGSWIALRDNRNRIIGCVLRTKRGCRPVFLSPGHKVTLALARKIILGTVIHYRIPEVTRIAHLRANRLRREFSS